MTDPEIIAYMRDAPDELVLSARHAYRCAEAAAVLGGFNARQCAAAAIVALELQVICDTGLSLIEGMRA